MIPFPDIVHIDRGLQKAQALVYKPCNSQWETRFVWFTSPATVNGKLGLYGLLALQQSMGN